MLCIEEHYTDTNGFTDHIFALCPPFGFRFAPRIRDLKDKNLYLPDDPKNYPPLASFLGEKINQKVCKKALNTLTTQAQGELFKFMTLIRYPYRNLSLKNIGKLFHKESHECFGSAVYFTAYGYIF